MHALISLLWFGLLSGAGAQMVDPAIDAGSPFGYLAKPSTVLGVKAGPEGTQVTFDGALYTGHAELGFFYGEPLRPVMVRNKELLDGYLPVVTWQWADGPVAYSITAFAATLDDQPTSNPVNFVRVTLQNTGEGEALAHFAAATRFSGRDHRCEGMTPASFSPDWRYEMNGDCVLRDGKLVYMFPAGAQLEAVPGVAYAQPFIGREHEVSERAEVCMVRYALRLGPGETRDLVFKMPLSPLGPQDTPSVEQVRSADYGQFLRKTVRFWEQELAGGAQIIVPERKVMDTWRASLVYDLIAIDQEAEDWVQKVNEFQYDAFWLRDGTYIVRSYDLLGHHATAERCLEHFRRYQRSDGLFSSQGGQLDGFGQALFALGQHYLMTGDLEYARRVYPHFPPAMAWLRRARAADQYHLMPPTHAHDNENIDGRYTGHNFWALLGARTAVRLARATGHEQDARQFLADYEDFRAALMQRLEQVCGADGYIPPGLDVEGGHDWGNLLGVYPAEVLDPHDPRETTTLARMHREKYAEGIMTYAGSLHHYLTVKATQNHVVRGEQEQALRDFYSILAHTGTTQEGFEMDGPPWGSRDSWGNYPPHGWCAAMINSLLRNMLIQERGGNGGLEGRELHLFSVISPAWVIPGDQVAIRNAPTEMGPVSASLRFSASGAELSVETRFRWDPTSIVLHLPYFVRLEGYETDAQSAHQEVGALVLSPDVTRVSLRWSVQDTPALSYQTVVDEYKREYTRRFADFVAGGGTPAVVEAPPLLTPDQRSADFARRWGLQVVGIAVGKPVTISGGTEADKAPERAVDGNAYDRDGSSWWAGPPTPRWLQVDLETPMRVDRVQVFPYWDGMRYYQYTVEVSTDAQTWELVGDMSTNTTPATEAGDVFRFEPREVRYVRVTMLHNSANPSVHLVELRVFAAQ